MNYLEKKKDNKTSRTKNNKQKCHARNEKNEQQDNMTESSAEGQTH